MWCLDDDAEWMSVCVCVWGIKSLSSADAGDLCRLVRWSSSQHWWRCWTQICMGITDQMFSVCCLCSKMFIRTVWLPTTRVIMDNSNSNHNTHFWFLKMCFHKNFLISKIKNENYVSFGLKRGQISASGVISCTTLNHIIFLLEVRIIWKLQSAITSGLDERFWLASLAGRLAVVRVWLVRVWLLMFDCY